MTERQKALASMISCVFFWGISFVSIKIAVAVFPPMTLGALRFAIGILFLLVIKRLLVPEERLEKRDLPYLLGAGMVGVTLYFFFENNGVALVSASEASIIVAAIPVLTMIAEWIWSCIRRFREVRRNSNEHCKGDRASGPEETSISPRQWLGAGVSVIGVWLVVGASLSVSGNIKGYLYMFGAAVSWVVYCFLTRPLFTRKSRIYIVFWQNLFGFIAFIPFALMEFPRWGRPTPDVFLHVLFLGICCSALGYWFYAHSLQVLGVTVSTVFVNMVPVVTVAAGFFVLGERLSALQWTGALLVIAGVYLAMMGPLKKPSRTKASGDSAR